MSSAVPVKKGKFPLKTHNQERYDFWIRLTTAAGAGAPVVTRNGGGLVNGALTDTGTGDFLLTLHPKFTYLSCVGNCQAAGYYVSCVCTEGASATNTIQILLFLGAAGATAAADVASKVIDLHCVGICRAESAA